MAKTKKFYKRTFILDNGEDNAVYPGWTNGETAYGGYECPRFEKIEADKILKEYTELMEGTYPAHYDEKQDIYFYPILGKGDDTELAEYKSEIIQTEEGEKIVYGIGYDVKGYDDGWVWVDHEEQERWKEEGED